MLALSILISAPALAATYTVTTTGDGAGLCTGTSCTTLRAAITAANATTTADDVIQFSVSGTITLTSALPWVTDTLSINGSGITLDGSGGTFGIINFSGAGASNSVLRDIAITNSLTNALVATASTANITITNNTLTGITNLDAIRCLNSNNCIITNNTINGTFGYGISVYTGTLPSAGVSGTISGNIINATTSNKGIGLGSVSGITVSNNQLLSSNSCGIELYQGNAAADNFNNVVSNNVMSGGTGIGICLEGSLGMQTRDNMIQGNTISNMGSAGIRVRSTSATSATSGNVIAGNIVTGNSRDGVAIIGVNTQNNAVYANAISGNGGLGIDLIDNGVTANDAGDVDTGPNGLQNFPVISRVAGTTVDFILDTPANANGYRIDFYNNPGGLDPTGFGEGQVHLGFCIVSTVGATVPNACSVAGVNPATLRTTATRCSNGACTTGATSEFSGPTNVDLQITKTNTPGSGPNDQAADTLASGQTTTYTLVVTNVGLNPVTGALVTDTPVAGLTCPGGNPVTISGNGLPSGGPFTVSNLTGGGITLGTLTAGQSTTLSFDCTVN